MSTDLSSKEEVKEPSQKGLKFFILVFGTIFLFFLGQILAIYAVVLGLGILGYNSSQIDSLLTGNPAMQFLAILLVEIITLGLLWWLHSLRKQPFFELIGIRNRPTLSSFSYAAATYGVYFLTLIVVVAVVSTLIPAINIEQAQQLGFNNVEGLRLVFVFLTLVILPPIAEEIIFRGFLFQRLKKLTSVYPAAIVTSIIFALAHTEFLGDNPLNWIAAIDTFILSFFLIFLLLKTKSLWASIFLHGIKNCIAFVVLFVM